MTRNHRLFAALLRWARSEIVLLAAGTAAVLSMAFVPPSPQYINYVDFRVLALLFCLMAVVSGLQSIGTFAVLGRRLIARARSVRWLCAALVMLCFFSSMLITNDVALITFVPFAVLVLTMTGQTRHTILVIVLQTVAANLGSMLTPVGNPQNLYLYSRYSLSAAVFFKATLPPVAISFLLLTAFCFLFKPSPIQVSFANDDTIASKRQLALYLGLFTLCLACVFHFLSWPVLLLLVIAGILLSNVTLFRRIDYSLLATFVCFFIFVGNLGQIEAVRNALAQAIAHRERWVAIVLSQVISNVPAAVLLSGFTDKVSELLVGVNLGGLGTPVASLASLISLKLYTRQNARQDVFINNPVHTGRYLLVFSAVNLLALAILSGLCLLLPS